MNSVATVFRQDLFTGQVAIVTGGGTGIGLRTARELAGLGATVVLASRRKEVIDAAAQAISDGGGKARAIVCNVRDEAQVKALVGETMEREGRVDLLVNNAGGQFPSPAESISRKGWEAVMETNLTGPFFVAQECFRQAFRAQGGGAIVSVLANFRSGFPTLAHTGAARAGMDNLTKSLAWEWGKHGVRVNAVAPGVIDSEGLKNYGEQMRGMLMRYGRFNATGRLGREGEVAAAIVFLLSPAARYLTGVTLPVDGGESLFNPFAEAGEHQKLPPWE